MIWAWHGFLGSGSDWQALAGVGGSWSAPDLLDRSILGWSLESRAEHLALEIEAQDPNPVLIGYSMGGRLALRALLARPKLFRRAVIVSTSTGGGDAEWRARRCAQDEIWARRFESEDWREVERDWNSQAVFQGEAPAFARAARDRTPLAWALRHWSPGRQDPCEARLHEITIPVLWVAGEKDSAYVEMATRAARQLPRCEIWIAPGAGHRVPWESPDFKSRLSRFLNGF